MSKVAPRLPAPIRPIGAGCLGGSNGGCCRYNCLPAATRPPGCASSASAWPCELGEARRRRHRRRNVPTIPAKPERKSAASLQAKQGRPHCRPGKLANSLTNERASERASEHERALGNESRRLRRARRDSSGALVFRSPSLVEPVLCSQSIGFSSELACQSAEPLQGARASCTTSATAAAIGRLSRPIKPDVGRKRLPSRSRTRLDNHFGPP